MEDHSLTIRNNKQEDDIHLRDYLKENNKCSNNGFVHPDVLSDMYSVKPE